MPLHSRGRLMSTTTNPAQYEFKLQRLGVVMRGADDDPAEAWGVLNPAVARTREGELLMFPRIVAKDNYSRIGIARVLFNDDEDPSGVERLGYALEPTQSYESNAKTAGVEDPRVTFVPALDSYVMGYCAYGPQGPRAALAVSRNLDSWQRLGVVKFAQEQGVDWNSFDNKDVFVFPDPVTAPDGRASIALVHRPTFKISWGFAESRAGIWMSYVALEDIADDLSGLEQVHSHTPVAFSKEPWEQLKIGGGTQPIRLADGNWLSVYHGVSGEIIDGVDHQPNVRYSGGAMVHSYADPTIILYRSADPILVPDEPEEISGIVDNVVFPTALDDRGDGRVDIYYGMADARIGVARLDVSVSYTRRA